MSKYQLVETGIYEYSLPDWKKPVFVSVFQIETEVFVKFGENIYPVHIDDIPENAIFSKWI